MKSRQLLTVEQLASKTGLAERTIYNQTGPSAKKRFPIRPIRWGGKVLFDASEVDAYIEKLLKERGNG